MDTKTKNNQDTNLKFKNLIKNDEDLIPIVISPPEARKRRVTLQNQSFDIGLMKEKIN